MRGQKNGYHQNLDARKELRLLISTLKYMKVMKKEMGILLTYTPTLDTMVCLNEFLFSKIIFLYFFQVTYFT